MDMKLLVSLVLFVAVIVFAWLWLQTRKQLLSAQRQSSEANSALQASLQRGGAQTVSKNESVEGVLLGSFDSDNLYRLVASGQTSIGGADRHFGIVEREDGSRAAFLTSHTLDHLRAGDCFAFVGGRITRVDADSFGADVARAEQPAVGPSVAAGAGDATVQVSASEIAAVAARQSKSSVASAVPDEDKTVVVQAQPDPVATRERQTAGYPFLRVVAGPDTGTDFYLGFGASIIGRDAANTVALADTAASRRHCEVTFHANRFQLRDNHSTNGTLCNGERIDVQDLEFGDKIEVADTEMVFSHKGFELKDSERGAAIAAFEACIEMEPNYLDALKLLAFLLERDIARQAEATPLWKRILELET